jgi:AraC-like DNA-binding protein
MGDDYRVKLLIDPEGPQPAYEAVDALVTVIINMCRRLHSKDFSPMLVRLRRPAPENTAAFEIAMRGPVEFGAGNNEIIIAGDAARKPLDSANAELARHNEKVITRYLAQFEKEDTISRVQSVLVGMLPNGVQSQEAVADALHMSLRNLQRKLDQKGTSWKDLLNSTRSELAKSYLKDSHYSISEIVFLLGFSDAGSFTRAFRRWEGVSPTAWRLAATFT